jgi:hypothetical protein
LRDAGTVLKNFRFAQHRPAAGRLDIEHSHSLKANERYLLYNVYVKGLESGVEEMTGLPKEKESSEPLSFPSTREAVMRSHEMDGPSLSEGRDRKLRNQLILANVIAWIAIGLAVRYFFF